MRAPPGVHKRRPRQHELALGTVLSGVVRECVYVGDTTRYVIDTGGGLSMVARIQNRSGEARASEGDRIRRATKIVFP